MGEPVRVLQGFINSEHRGLSRYITDLYQGLDKTKIQFDFLAIGKEKLSYEEDLIQQGANVYHISHLTHPFLYFKTIREIVEFKKYNIFCANISHASILPLLAARMGGAPIVIAHAHSSNIYEISFVKRALTYLYHSISKFFIKYVATNYFACSDLAAAWVFGKKIFSNEKYKFMPNAINCDKYVFNKFIRTKIRDQFMVKNNFIIGQVGAFNYPKNHEFLIRVFVECKKLEPSCELWLVGEGELKPNVEAQIKELGLDNSVRLFGKRNDVNELMQAMDVFVLTSHFEGFPIVGVEAQAAGLPCIFADTITQQANITGLVEYIGLEASCQEWGAKIVEAAKNTKRCNTTALLVDARFDKTSQIEELTDFYCLYHGVKTLAFRRNL